MPQPRTIPTATTQRGDLSPSRGARRPRITAPAVIAARISTANRMFECTVNTTAHATNAAVSAHARTADTERWPSARAIATPGSSTTIVPKARRR